MYEIRRILRARVASVMAFALGCASFVMGTTGTAWADNRYPLSGQDTVYTAERSGLTLFDKDRRVIQLINNHPYRLRFSNESRSFHIMPGDGTTREFRVIGGFPGGNLENFDLDGAQFGNPGVRISKRERREVTHVGSRIEDYNCTYLCGRDYVCRDIPETVCETRYERVCRQIRDEVCRIENGRRICTPVMRTVCENVPRRVCRTVYRRVCQYQDRYCGGYETWRVEDQLERLIFGMTITGPDAVDVMGAFSAVLESRMNTRRVELIRTTCR